MSRYIDSNLRGEKDNLSHHSDSDQFSCVA